MGKFKNFLNCHNFRCVQESRNFWFYCMVFGVGLINGDIYIYPQLTPIAMATKFETKMAITRVV